MQAQKGRKASWAWASLLQGRQLLEHGVRWQVGNGKSIKFWKDKWIPRLPGFQMSNSRPPDYSISLVSDVVVPNRTEWNITKLGTVVSAEVLANIWSIPISCEDQDDVVIWHYTPKGHYEVRNGYHIAIQNSLQFDSKLAASPSFSPPASMWSLIWSLNIPPKVRHFWWRVCQNKLATKENLFRRKCAPSSQCPACACPVESIEHLLFHCPWTRTVWFGSDLGIRVDMQVCNSVAEWTYSIMNMCSNKSAQLQIIGKMAMVGWCIWKSRNDWVFNHNPLNPMVTLHHATAAWRELSVLNPLGARQPNAAVFEPPSRSWSPPGLGLFKLNCDASFTKDGSKASLVAILRNREEQLVDGRTSIVYVSSTLQGEARAVRMACAFSQTLNLRQISVEGDSKSVIELSVSELVPPWDCMAIIHDIRSAKSRNNISFCWSPRSSNREAHWVASRNLTCLLPLDWVAHPPPTLRAILSMDSL
ncbi:hypothetical protein ACSBR1_016032 [Camellia fascicularis]